MGYRSNSRLSNATNRVINFVMPPGATASSALRSKRTSPVPESIRIANGAVVASVEQTVVAEKATSTAVAPIKTTTWERSIHLTTSGRHQRSRLRACLSWSTARGGAGGETLPVMSEVPNGDLSSSSEAGLFSAGVPKSTVAIVPSVDECLAPALQSKPSASSGVAVL